MEESEFGYEDLASEEAIALVYFDEASKEFVVNPEAIKFLKTIEAPLGVIAVAGMYRTGKSYLLNRVLLDRNNGFGVGNTVNACTKGLWVWKKVIKGKTPDKEDVNVLVVDSEGLGALDEDSNHDVRIFSLAILLSSYFIYNSMGSIDENAVQSLSLVIQLTKHIQIKASGLTQDVDPEEYSRYFPNFMWVVRDFSLQLVDHDGESITSKDYLESALKEQKGFSEAAEQKNRIRRLLRCFFKERDCCTVVRPSTQEEDLQSLESKPFESLREEFRTQITQLRSKVMKRIKPKTVMGGQKLNGSMFADLVENYVTAINKGAVPNIENAWTYISKGECQKAMEKSFDSFCQEFTEAFSMHAPMYEADLRDAFKEAKISALAQFDQTSVGDVAEQFKEDLIARMKQKYSQIKAENEKESRKEAQIFLQNHFSPVEDKLRNQEYSDFSQYDKDIKEIEQNFMDRGPPGPNREAICQQYIINALTDGADYFIRTLKHELSLQGTLNKESTSKLEARIQEMKTDLNKYKDEYDTKIRSSENEKAKLIANEQSTRESLNEVKREKENAEKEWKERLQAEKADTNRLVEEYKSRMQASEESSKEAQRRMVSSESESDKQKALLEQKVKFLEDTIETLKQKEKEYQAEIKNQKKELMSSMKDNNTKYEEKIHTLNKRLDEAHDELAEKENKVSELEQKVYVTTSALSEKDLELKNLRAVALEAQELREENETLKSEMEENSKMYSQELQEEHDNLKFQVEELKIKIQQKDSAIQGENAKWEKENTIQQQKIDFLNTQVNEFKNQIDENRKTHEAMMKAVQSRESEKGEAIQEADKKIEDLKREHFNEMKEMEERFESTSKRLSEELEKVRKSEGELKMNLKILSSDNDKEIADLKDALEQAEHQRDRALAESKQTEQQKQDIIQQTENRYKHTIQQLEAELEQKDSKSQEEIQDQQKRSEEDLSQLKSYYEQEKERLEKKLGEEKDRSAKNVQACREDYEQRMLDEQQQHEDELEMIQEELRDKEDQLQASYNRYDHEISLSEQKISTLEAHLKETKKALDDIQEKSAVTLEHQMGNFNKERKEVLDKCDALNQSLTEKEKRITALENQNESLVYQSKKKDDEIETMRTEFHAQKKQLEDQVEKVREDSQKLSDSAMGQKLDLSRKEALTQQKIEFQEKKIEELLKALTDSSITYQEKLDSQKNELGEEVNTRIQQATAEKDRILAKFDEKKKAYKELEKNTSIKITKLERDRAVNLERIENLEKKMASEQEYSKKQIDSLREKVASMQESGSQSVHNVEQKYDDLKVNYANLEKERNELRSQYEKEEALWKGKAEFLEEQRTQLKKDLADSHKKLEQSINQLQNKSGMKDADKKQMDIIARMERDYKDQINSLNESHEKFIKELSDKNKDLEQKYHTLQEKYELTYRDSSSSARNLEKRVNDYEQREKTHLEEITELKQQRDKMILEHQSRLDQERDSLKQKISELEKRCKIGENEKGRFTIELEKERAKWNADKDHLETAKNDLQEQISRLQKKNETLHGLNEKLKEKTRGTRKYNKYGGSGLANSSYMESGPSSRYTAKNFLGVKEMDADAYSNNSGKGSRFQTFTKFIGDGGKEGDKKSINSGDIEKTPDRVGKESESTNTFSPPDDNEEN